LQTSISIVIVNYDTSDLLRNCLNSVFSGQVEIAEVWVVDNGSTDGSLEMIKTEFPSVNVIKNLSNFGYGFANNQAMKIASGKYFILLNSDTIISPGAFQRLALELDEHPDIGMAGPQLTNQDGTIQPSFGKFMNTWITFAYQFFLYKIIPVNFPLGDTIKPAQDSQYRHDHEVDWLSGACLAVRRDAVDKAGMLDEGLFMYGEDMEWCWRIHNAGYRIRFCAEAKITHLSRQSSRKDFSKWITSYTIGNLRFVQHHGTAFSFRSCGLFTFFGSIFRSLLWRIFSVYLRERKVESRQRISGYSNAARIGWIVFIKGKLTFQEKTRINTQH